jgi:hypothetical protein
MAVWKTAVFPSVVKARQWDIGFKKEASSELRSWEDCGLCSKGAQNQNFDHPFLGLWSRYCDSVSIFVIYVLVLGR